MKAVVYKGAFEVAVEEVEDPQIEQPRTRSSASRRRTSAGRTCTPTRAGRRWTRAWCSATRTWASSRRSAPAWTGSRSGTGYRCRSTSPAAPAATAPRAGPRACLRANPSGQPGAGYGYPQMGPYRGGQAEYLRVPWADFNLLEAARRHRARERLHDAVRHLPHRLPRHRTRRGRAPGRRWRSSAPGRSG